MFSAAIRDAINAMHNAGISRSQIDICGHARRFVLCAETTSIAAAGLARLAEIAGRTLPEGAAGAFLRAFITSKHKSSIKVVRRFSNGFKTMRRLRRFLVALRHNVRDFEDMREQARVGNDQELLAALSKLGL